MLRRRPAGVLRRLTPRIGRRGCGFQPHYRTRQPLMRSTKALGGVIGGGMAISTRHALSDTPANPRTPAVRHQPFLELHGVPGHFLLKLARAQTRRANGGKEQS